MANKKDDIKQVDNKIMWWNGKKWLIKETCYERGATPQNVAIAKKRLKELNGTTETTNN